MEEILYENYYQVGYFSLKFYNNKNKYACTQISFDDEMT